MTDTAAPQLTASEILASLTDDQLEQQRLSLLAVSAQGEGVEAVCDFGELVFGVVAAKHHRLWLEQMLTAPDSGLSGPRVSVTAPPESAKTTWGTIIKTAWYIGKNPERAYGIGSAGEQAADDMAKAVAKTIETNPRWGLVFPNVVPNKERGWSSDGYFVRRTDLPAGEWEILTAGNKNPTLVSGGVGSARWNGLRLTGGLTLDDIHDRKSKTEQATCDDVVGFFKDTAEYRVTGKGYLHILQTRWNNKDVIAEVKKRRAWVIFEHPAIQTLAGREVSYWPEWHPVEKLQAIRENSPVDFELQFQGNDRAIEGHLLKQVWLHDWPFAQIGKTWNRYFGVDFAQRLREVEKAGDDPDFFAIAVWADTGARLVLEDVFAEELYFGDAEDLFFAKAAIYKPANCGVEVNGASAKKFYLALLARARLLKQQALVITQVVRSKAKGDYLRIVAPLFKSAQIMVSDEPTPGLALFRSQWVMFPQGHDDTLDAMYNGYSIAGHLLPQENQQDKQERAERAAQQITPAQMIERAYG